MTDPKDPFKQVLGRLAKQIEANKKSGYIPPPPAAPACATCKDLRSVQPVQADGSRYAVNHPMFSQVIPCPDCGGPGLRDADIGLMPGDLARLDWSSIKTIPANKEGMDAGVAAVKLVLALGHGWVYLHGSYGKGKSLLLEIATAVSRRAGNHAQYLTMTEMMDNLRASFEDDSDTTLERRIKRWEHLPVLCVDEFEKVNTTGFVDERKFQVLNHRWRMAAAHQPSGITIIGANVPPEEIGSGALTDRIRDERFHVVDMDNPGSISARRISKGL